MSLIRLEAESFRCFDRMACSLEPGLNWFYGPNAIGKTSLLEALYVGLTGRSFRAHTIEECIQKDHDYVCVRIYPEEPEPHLTWMRARSGESRVHWGESLLRRWSDVALRYPVLFFDTHSHRQFSGAADVRRKFIDWLMFHVKHEHRLACLNYRKAMEHRARALKWDEDPSVWEHMMVRYGKELASTRRAGVEALRAAWQSGWGADLALDYEPGYEGEDLLAVLVAQRASDKKRGYAQAGPHRADLLIRLEGRDYAQRLSLGQQKVMVCELMLEAVILVWRQTGVKPLWLMDDVGAELDESTRYRVFEQLHAMGLQAIITTLDARAYGDAMRPRPLTELLK